ncbi:Rap1a/Tai family immunity protein [Azonexus sp. R2A61]|uniref:Rap1a/Tai family immunity protein n=1 Tax=Azonexus sp. R2A61 TaxID=2744443 RepID=UPI001F2DB63A|nr:Rap1a/Tai family immunity protein [Azonexus sp. R2A61]
MIKLLILCSALLAGSAHAYTAQELLEDCRQAERMYGGEKNSDPIFAMRSGRCISYVAGFADGYAVSDYLAGKIGMKINAFCLPNDDDLSMRLVRAVVIHVERVPPSTTATTATLVAGALAKAFPCPDSLESKK